MLHLVCLVALSSSSLLIRAKHDVGKGQRKHKVQLISADEVHAADVECHADVHAVDQPAHSQSAHASEEATCRWHDAMQGTHLLAMDSEILPWAIP